MFTNNYVNKCSMSRLETPWQIRKLLRSVLNAQVDIFLSMTWRMQLYMKPNITLNVLLKGCLNSQTSFLWHKCSQLPILFRRLSISELLCDHLSQINYMITLLFYGVLVLWKLIMHTYIILIKQLTWQISCLCRWEGESEKGDAFSH